MARTSTKSGTGANKDIATAEKPVIASAVRNKSKPKPDTSAGQAGTPCGPAADDPMALLGQLQAETPLTLVDTNSKSRPTLELSPAARKAFEAWVPAKKLCDTFTINEDLLNVEFKGLVFDQWIDLVWEKKAIPQNPRFNTDKKGTNLPDMSAMFQVQKRLSVQGESAAETTQLLIDMGVDAQNAKALVAVEISYTPVTALRSFTELSQGHRDEGEWVPATDVERAAASKLLLFAMGKPSEPLNADERKVAITNDPCVVVKSPNDFFGRILTYANTRDQLAAIFKVIQPVYFNGQAKFAISDTVKARADRLVDEAKSVLGTNLEKIEAIQEEKSKRKPKKFGGEAAE
jgi:hypothetical protein